MEKILKNGTLHSKRNFKNMYDKKVMLIVNYNSVPKKNANIIDTLWVLFIKNDNSKKKAKVVAKGCQQTEEKDFFSTLTPTAQSESLRISIAITSINKWKLRQLDIKAAYLNADLNETIQVKIPKGDKYYNNKK